MWDLVVPYISVEDIRNLWIALRGTEEQYREYLCNHIFQNNYALTCIEKEQLRNGGIIQAQLYSRVFEQEALIHHIATIKAFDNNTKQQLVAYLRNPCDGALRPLYDSHFEFFDLTRYSHYTVDFHNELVSLLPMTNSYFSCYTVKGTSSIMIVDSTTQRPIGRSDGVRHIMIDRRYSGNIMLMLRYAYIINCKAYFTTNDSNKRKRRRISLEL